MTRLTATFNVPLSSTILFRGDRVPRTYAVVIEGFDVVLTISRQEDRRSKHKNERLWTYMSKHLVVSVSRNETETPPHDFTARVPYFKERNAEYARVALQVL